MQSSWMSRTNGIRKYLPGFFYSIHGHPFPLASGWLKNGYGTQGICVEPSPGQWVWRWWQLGLLGKVLSYLRRWAHFFLWRNPQNCCILVPTYLRRMCTHGKGPSRGNVGAAKQPPNIWCLELSLPLGLYCWGVGGNPPSHCWSWLEFGLVVACGWDHPNWEQLWWKFFDAVSKSEQKMSTLFNKLDHHRQPVPDM